MAAEVTFEDRLGAQHVRNFQPSWRCNSDGVYLVPQIHFNYEVLKKETPGFAEGFYAH